MPAGYRFDFDPNAVADVVLGKSTWAVLALTLDIELFTQQHYRKSIDPDPALSPLFRAGVGLTSSQSDPKIRKVFCRAIVAQNDFIGFLKAPIDIQFIRNL